VNEVNNNNIRVMRRRALHWNTMFHYKSK